MIGVTGVTGVTGVVVGGGTYGGSTKWSVTFFAGLGGQEQS